MIEAIKVKGLRADIQSFIDFVKAYNVDSREVSIAVQKLEEAKMWFGKYLGTLPEGGEDLNAKRDAEEIAQAYPEAAEARANEPAPAPAPEAAQGEDTVPAEQPAEEAPAPAEGEDLPAEDEPEDVAPEGAPTPAAEGQDVPADEAETPQPQA